MGAGTFGVVLAAIDKTTGQKVAIKFMKRGESITRHVERELVNHSVLKHPHVIELREVFLTPEYLGMVMEYATGGTLFDMIADHGGLSENDARLLFQQLVLGLDYCHRCEDCSPSKARVDIGIYMLCLSSRTHKV